MTDNVTEESLGKEKIIKKSEKIIKNDENIIENAVKLVKPKAKRIPSEAQLAGLAKGRASRDAKLLKKREEEKILFEEKILKKALSIKKKQVNKNYALAQLDNISDDDTPIEEIKQKHRAMTPPPVRPLLPVIQHSIQSQPQIQKVFSFL